MKNIILFIMSGLMFLTTFGQNGGKLYPISEGVVYGFIDKIGKVVIPPKFGFADEFSEGLAAVTIDGKFGYIDASGKICIPGRYDDAGLFQNGTANVKINGKPYVIDKKGIVLFEHRYNEIKDFGNNSFAIVVTASGKYGVINKKGKLIADTVFKAIDDFHDGMAVVQSLRQTLSKNENKNLDEDDRGWGVIDTTGRLVIGYDRYRFISWFKNGFTLALPLIFKKDSPDRAIIDRTGKQRFFIPEKKYRLTYADGQFHGDLAAVEVYKPGYDPDTATTDATGKHAGVINGDGEIVFSDTGWSFITPFANNRAFAATRKGKWIMIDRNGQAKSKSIYENVVFDRNQEGQTVSTPFQEGTAFVRLGNAYCLIDTLGNILETVPDFKDSVRSNAIRYRRVGRRLIKLAPYDSTNLYSEYSYHVVGFYNERTRTTIDLSGFNSISMNDISKDLIHVYKEQRMVYINDLGQIVWKSLPPEEIPPPPWKMRIDHIDINMYSGAPASKPISKLQAQSFTPSQGELQAFIDTYQPRGCYRYQSRKLFIANSRADTAFFISMESQLNVLLQAKDKDGIWRDIQRMDDPICGNSFRMRALPPGEYWEFCSPVYEGIFKTKIRAKIELLRGRDWDDKVTIYSNEVSDTINPRQFLEKQPLVAPH